LITIPFTTDDLTKVRFSPSPLWETVSSFGVLTHPDRHAVHAPWAGRARRALRGMDLSPLVAATGVGGRCPDYLSPPPDASLSTFREELERLRATPPEIIHAEVRMLVQEEKELLARLPSEKERMQGLLDGDVFRRGRALALGGVETLLSGLDPRVGYKERVLTLDISHEAAIDTAGQGVTLVPCVFSWPDVFVLTRPGYRPTLAYAPRGVANLWTSSPEPNGTALEAALSVGRATVLKGLLVPHTTSDLARQLGMSPAAVSAHLSRLKTAGLVESHRSGKRVFYRLSGAGESLLGIFGELA